MVRNLVQAPCKFNNRLYFAIKETKFSFTTLHYLDLNIYSKADLEPRLEDVKRIPCDFDNIDLQKELLIDPRTGSYWLTTADGKLYRDRKIIYSVGKEMFEKVISSFVVSDHYLIVVISPPAKQIDFTTHQVLGYHLKTRRKLLAFDVVSRVSLGVKYIGSFRLSSLHAVSLAFLSQFEEEYSLNIVELHGKFLGLSRTIHFGHKCVAKENLRRRHFKLDFWCLQKNPFLDTFVRIRFIK